MNPGIEIERKYVIKLPDIEKLRAMPDYTVSDISQTYLMTSEDGVSERVRRRTWAGDTRFYHTVKRRIDDLSCKEDEREIAYEEYASLIRRRDEHTRTLEKTRYTFSFGGLTVEIDKYAGWERIAMLEVELPSRDVTPMLPDFIDVVFEATGNFAFSNASLAKRFPSEKDVMRDYL